MHIPEGPPELADRTLWHNLEVLVTSTSLRHPGRARFAPCLPVSRERFSGEDFAGAVVMRDKGLGGAD